MVISSETAALLGIIEFQDDEPYIPLIAYSDNSFQTAYIDILSFMPHSSNVGITFLTSNNVT